jgi:hypothetical protein
MADTPFDSIESAREYVRLPAAEMKEGEAGIRASRTPQGAVT